MEDSQSQIKRTAIEVHLKEYEGIRDQIVKYLELQSQVALAVVIGLGTLIPLIPYIESVETQGGNGYILLLLASLIFCALGIHLIWLDNEIYDMGIYIQYELTPKIQRLISPINNSMENVTDFDFLEWERFGKTKRFSSFSELWLGIGALGRFAIVILSPAGLLTYYFYGAHILNSKPWSFVDIGLVLFILLSIIWMPIALTFIGAKRNIISKK